MEKSQKLDGPKYNPHKPMRYLDKMTTSLKEVRVHRIVKGEETEEAHSGHHKFMFLNRCDEAMAMMAKSLGPLKSIIADAGDDPVIAWVLIVGYVEKKCTADGARLEDDFYTKQKHPSVSMEIHCTEMQELKEEIVKSGGRLDDVNLMHAILRSLPHKKGEPYYDIHSSLAVEIAMPNSRLDSTSLISQQINFSEPFEKPTADQSNAAGQSKSDEIEESNNPVSAFVMQHQRNQRNCWFCSSKGHLIYDSDKLFQKMLERRNIPLDSLPRKEKCSVCVAREAEDDRAIEEIEECVNIMSTILPDDPQMGW